MAHNTLNLTNKMDQNNSSGAISQSELATSSETQQTQIRSPQNDINALIKNPRSSAKDIEPMSLWSLLKSPGSIP